RARPPPRLRPLRRRAPLLPGAEGRRAGGARRGGAGGSLPRLPVRSRAVPSAERAGRRLPSAARARPAPPLPRAPAPAPPRGGPARGLRSVARREPEELRLVAVREGAQHAVHPAVLFAE